MKKYDDAVVKKQQSFVDEAVSRIEVLEQKQDPFRCLLATADKP